MIWNRTHDIHCLHKEIQQRLKKGTTTAVSFDIFDTALGRIFAEPHDLFLLVEAIVEQKTHQSRPFAASRYEAEALARRKTARLTGQQEITLDDIYKVLFEMGFSGSECALYKQEELATELACCYPIPNVFSAYQAALEAGKTVVFISDMYLPRDLIAKMLDKCGYSSYADIFISNEIGTTKTTGDLYKAVMNKLKASKAIEQAGQLLHIGDNLHSDLRQARKQGISALRVARASDTFRRKIRHWPLLRQIERDCQPLEASLLIGLHAHYWLTSRTKKDNALSWQDVGFFVMGPMLYGFARWLHAQCQQDGHQKMHFLSRDGFIFKQAFDLLAPALQSSVTSAYVYGSRRATFFPSISDLNEGAFDLLIRSSRPIAAQEYISRLGIDAAPYYAELTDIFGDINTNVRGHDERLRALFHRIFPRLSQEIEKERTLLTKYMASTGLLAEKVALCDIGYRGSMQAGLAHLADLAGHSSEYSGYYFATLPSPIWNHLITKGWICQNGKPEANRQALWESIPILELFFTAQHGTVLKFIENAAGEPEPLMEEPNSDEQERFRISTELQSGALLFIRSVIDWGILPELSGKEDFALAGWKALTQTPSGQLLKLFSLPTHNDGAGASSSVPILTKIPFWKILFHPFRSSNEFAHAYWRKGTLLTMPWIGRILLIPVLMHRHALKNLIWRQRQRLSNNRFIKFARTLRFSIHE